MPNRIISTGICASESLAGLSWFEQILFLRLIVSADDYGRYDARPQIIKGHLFPLDDITVKNIQSAITKLSTNGMISLYEVAGRPYLELCAWRKYNTPRAKESKYPERPIYEKVQADENTCSQVQADSPVFDIRNSYSDSIFEDKGAPAPTSPHIDFEKIMDLYNTLLPSLPKCAKLSAARRKAIKARFSSGYTEDDFRSLFQKCAESEFLMGKNGRNWSATFDWLIQDGNMAKVLSGNYDNRCASAPKGASGQLGDAELEAIRRVLQED